MKPKSYYQKYKKPRLHVLVWEEANGPVPEGYVVDHKDGDIHNNDLSNLRLATVAENIRNSKLYSTNKVGLKGVSWDKARGCFRAAILVNGKQHSFRGSLLDACCFAISKRKELHGDFARFR